MNHIFVPSDKGHRYYDTHYRFFIKLMEVAGNQVGYYSSRRTGRGFVAMADKLRIHIDFGDHSDVALDADEYDIRFRYHFRLEDHSHMARTYPLTPISFYNWGQYYSLREQIRYGQDEGFILNNQKPGKAAAARRGKVQYMLKDHYRARADTEITDKVEFWKKVDRCLVSVCVPGARNDILDRGQFQYWAFGACTISPRLNIVLPYWTEPKPGIHYIECAPDYSDLIDKIEACRKNRELRIEIGTAAKELFTAVCTPERVWSWMKVCINERRGGKNVSHPG